MVRAGLYTRISRDRDERRVGVDRQESDGRATACQLGWVIVEVFDDNDRSAKDGRHRPQFERMLEWIDAARLDAVIGWDNDRIARAPADVERLIALAKRTGLRFATRHGETDLALAHGQLTARIKGAVADYEVTQMGERIARAKRANAEAGLPTSFCPFGWRREVDVDDAGRIVATREVLDPESSTVLLEAAARIGAGESLRALALDWTARPVPTPRARAGHQGPQSARWDPGMVRQLLLRDRNAGLRTYRGEVIGRGVWEPLWDEATHHRLVTLLRDPARRTGTGNGRAVHLLSGIARCGRCDDGGRIHTLAANDGTRRVYVCRRCLRIRRDQRHVDELVIAVVCDLLAGPDAAAIFTPPEDESATAAAADVAALRARMDNAADSFAQGLIDQRQLTRITAQLRPKLEQAEAVVRARATTPDLVDLARADIAEVWPSLPLDRRRTAIRHLLDVTILPTVRGAGVFRPEHVRVARRGTA